MTSIVAGIDYSLLFGGTGSVSSSLLAAAQGTVAGTVAVSTNNPVTALTLAGANETKGIAAEAKDVTVARDIAAFKKGVADAKTIDAALSNPDVLKVFLTANGLGSQVSFTALAKKALLSDPNDPAGLANKLATTNSSWLSVAKTFDFASNGLSTLHNPTVIASITQGYAQVKWDEAQDAQWPGLSNALQFQQQAAAITSVDQILGDPVNRDVVLTALNIPLQIAYQSISAQETAIATKLDISKLQDVHFVQTLAQRYLLNKAQAAPRSTDLTTLAAGIVV